MGIRFELTLSDNTAKELVASGDIAALVDIGDIKVAYGADANDGSGFVLLVDDYKDQNGEAIQYGDVSGNRIALRFNDTLEVKSIIACLQSLITHMDLHNQSSLDGRPLN